MSAPACDRNTGGHISSKHYPAIIHENPSAVTCGGGTNCPLRHILYQALRRAQRSAVKREVTAVTLHDLKCKDVIQFKTGENLGRIDDVRFDEVSAQLQGVVLHGRRHLFGLLGRDDDLEIAWKDIKSIGLDVVMVDAPEAAARPPKRSLFGF